MCHRACLCDDDFVRDCRMYVSIHGSFRMVNPDLDGLEGKWDKDSTVDKDDQLKIPTDSRLYAVMVGAVCAVYRVCHVLRTVCSV